jgi:hypothetical protein
VKGLRTVTVLRDPVARTFSHWQHFANDANPDNRTFAHEQTFDEFVADERNRWNIENLQARYLAQSTVPLEAIAARLERDGLSPGKLQDGADRQGLDLSPDELERRATAALASMDVVGTTEYLHAFLCDCARAFGWSEPGLDAVPRLNLPRKTFAMDIARPTYERIIALTRVDSALYEQVRARAAARSCEPSLSDTAAAQPQWLESRLRFMAEALQRLQQLAHDRVQNGDKHDRWVESEIAFIRRYIDDIDPAFHSLHRHAEWAEAEIKLFREHVDRLRSERLAVSEPLPLPDDALPVRLERLQAELDRAHQRADKLEATLAELRADFVWRWRERARGLVRRIRRPAGK